MIVALMTAACSPAAAARHRCMPCALHTLELHAANSVIVVTHSPRELGVRDADLEHWVWDAAAAVQTYYGRFPVQRLNVDVEPTNGLGPQSGAAFGFGVAGDPHERGTRQRRQRLDHRLDADP